MLNVNERSQYGNETWRLTCNNGTKDTKYPYFRLTEKLSDSSSVLNVIVQGRVVLNR